MVTLMDIQRSARITHDENGQPVIQVPLALWEAVIGPLEKQEIPQHERIRAVLDAWEQVVDDQSEAWWDAFDTFMQANRFQINDRNLDDK
ncbi:MAG: hypothetical protein JNJ61_07965 [Anaerolineae bacterium]|nr:hypothetical protein [Anaerolineae bacterium]